MSKDFGTIKKDIANYLGIIDPSGNAAFDATTPVTLYMVNSLLNDSYREIGSEYPYDNLFTARTYPFYHTIPDAAGIFLSGISNPPLQGEQISANLIPYGMSLFTPNLNLQTYSGLTFTGTDTGGTVFTGTSMGGYPIHGPITTVGFQYPLEDDVDRIHSITVPGTPIKVKYISQYDINRFLPQGEWTITGTVALNYTTFPGINSSGNTVIGFYPQPAIENSGQSFTVYYQKKHRDLVLDSEVQTILPSQFEDIATYWTLNKIYTQLSVPDKAQYFGQLAQKRVYDLKRWNENNIDNQQSMIDGDELGFNPFMSTDPGIWNATYLWGGGNNF